MSAIATAAGLANSAVGSAAYTIAAATPGFSPIAGSYGSTQSVTISDATGGATIYYTTNGTTPNTTSSTYSGAISVSATRPSKRSHGPRLRQKRSRLGGLHHCRGHAGLLPHSRNLHLDPDGDHQRFDGGATIYYTTDGTRRRPRRRNTPAASPFLHLRLFRPSQRPPATKQRCRLGCIHHRPGCAATPTFSPVAGTYGSAQSVTISDATGSSTIYYTTNGSTPTTNSPTYSAAISVSANETIEAIATATGYSTSATGSAAYTIQAATPGFSPAAGTYTTIQTVTISDSTVAQPSTTPPMEARRRQPRRNIPRAITVSGI